MEACSERSFGTISDLPPLPPRGEAPALVMFSGGSDSTLLASLFAQQHTVVHLVTYHHRVMTFAEKSANAFGMLQKAFGADRFVHRIMDVNDLMSRIFVRPLPGDPKKYGTYALPMCCGSCKLSMHVRSIMYCREHGIRFAAVGSNAELSEHSPEQFKPVLELYRQLYARYGIDYSNPVFDIERSDHRLYDMGITPKRDYKSEKLSHTNQHSCAAGFMLYGFTLGVGLPLLGTSNKKELARRYIGDKIEQYCIPFLDAELGVGTN